MTSTKTKIATPESKKSIRKANRIATLGLAVLAFSSFATSAFADNDDRGNKYKNKKGKQQVTTSYSNNIYYQSPINYGNSVTANTLDRRTINQLLANQQELIELKQQLAQQNNRTQFQDLMTSVADGYAQQGSWNQAITAQQEGLLANYEFGNLDPYKQLGEYYESAGDTTIKAYVNGKLINTGIEPFTHQGRTLVPLRAVSEELQSSVTWYPADQSIRVTRGDTTIDFYLNSKTVWVNGVKKVLDVPVQVRDGSTFIPLRALGELLGAHVTYIPEGNIAIFEDESLKYEESLDSLFPVKSDDVDDFSDVSEDASEDDDFDVEQSFS